MLDPIPFRRTRGIMAHRDAQAGGIDQAMLQRILPQAWPIAIAPAAIGQDQHFGGAPVVHAPRGVPPPPNRIDGEFGRVGGDTHVHKPRVVPWVVDAIRDGHPFSQRTKVIHIHAMGVATPRDTGVLKPSDQLAFLGIHVDDRPAALEKGLFLAVQILKLLIAVGTGQRQLFAVGLERIIQRFQQAAHRWRTGRMRLAQGGAQPAQALVFPFERATRVARRLLFEQLLQDRHDRQVFFSTRRRPPPGRRMRSLSCACANSRRPWAMVSTLKPVMRARGRSPPCPSFLDSKPTYRRRCRSSRVLTKKFIWWCKSLIGWTPRRRHSAHWQRCNGRFGMRSHLPKSGNQRDGHYTLGIPWPDSPAHTRLSVRALRPPT